MLPTTIHQCQCSDCLQPGNHPNKALHRQLNLLLARLDEQQRRWLAAWESKRIGHGGDRLLSVITGLLGYIQDTTTESGLKVKAVLLPGKYKTGLKVTDQEMQGLRLRRHRTCPTWNYTIKPRKGR